MTGVARHRHRRVIIALRNVIWSHVKWASYLSKITLAVNNFATAVGLAGGEVGGVVSVTDGPDQFMNFLAGESFDGLIVLRLHEDGPGVLSVAEQDPSLPDEMAPTLTPPAPQPCPVAYRPWPAG